MTSPVATPHTACSARPDENPFGDLEQAPPAQDFATMMNCAVRTAPNKTQAEPPSGANAGFSAGFSRRLPLAIASGEPLGRRPTDADARQSVDGRTLSRRGDGNARMAEKSGVVGKTNVNKKDTARESRGEKSTGGSSAITLSIQAPAPTVPAPASPEPSPQTSDTAPSGGGAVCAVAGECSDQGASPPVPAGASLQSAGLALLGSGTAVANLVESSDPSTVSPPSSDVSESPGIQDPICPVPAGSDESGPAGLNGAVDPNLGGASKTPSLPTPLQVDSTRVARPGITSAVQPSESASSAAVSAAVGAEAAKLSLALLGGLDQTPPGEIPGHASTQGAGKKALALVGQESDQPSAETGMLAASLTGTMRAEHEMAEIACRSGQELPAFTGGTDSARPLGRDQKETVTGSHAVAALTGAADSVTVLTGHSASPAHEPLGHTGETASPSGAVEAVHRAIENATMGLERMGAASVSMVLKPDADTQLAVHLKWQQGHFEALAVLERGDFSALGAEWSRLQHRLAEQGVRLAPLVSSMEQSALSSGGHSPSPKQQSETAPPAKQTAPSTARTPVRKSGGRTVSAANGREWWA